MFKPCHHWRGRRSKYVKALLLIAANHSRLLVAVTESSATHDTLVCTKTHLPRLGWGSTAGSMVNSRKGDVLVVLSQMEMSTKPSLDATILTDNFDKLAAFHIVGMIQPAAAIDDMIFLQDTKSTFIGRSGGKGKDFSSLITWMSLIDGVFKPFELFLVNGGNFMQRVLPWRRGRSCWSKPRATSFRQSHV
jgi:hypothetical protein